MKKILHNTIKDVLEDLGFDGLEFSLEKPTRSEFGDYSSNAPMTAFAQMKASKEGSYQSQEDIANQIVAKIGKIENLDRIEFRSGFLNFWLSNEYYHQVIKDLVKNQKVTFPQDLKGKTARVEYISANPTGPLHIGNARGGPTGETLSRVLEKVGFKVLREYYLNDTGTQIERFGESILYWYKKELGKESEFPKDGYKGDYVRDLAKLALATFKDSLISRSETDARRELADFGVRQMYMDVVEEVAKKSGIEFDLITKEQELLESGLTKEVLTKLKSGGFTKEQEGAVWFAPNDIFLKDRECVLVRSDGRPTYFANDIAYHDLKFKTKPDLVVDVFGSNHHGHVPRLQAAVGALGYDVEKFKVLLYQYVRVRKGESFVKMAKREGDFVSAKEVLDEVGKDAFNFFMLLNSSSTHMDFDLDLAKAQNKSNPVYFVQYAHARCNNILTKAPSLEHDADLSVLTDESEIALIKKMSYFPELVEIVARSFDLHLLAHFGISLADDFHSFYEKCPVISENKKLQAARLVLVSTLKVTLSELLGLLNVTAPNRM